MLKPYSNASLTYCKSAEYLCRPVLCSEYDRLSSHLEYKHFKPCAAYGLLLSRSILLPWCIDCEYSLSLRHTLVFFHQLQLTKCPFTCRCGIHARKLIPHNPEALPLLRPFCFTGTRIFIVNKFLCVHEPRKFPSMKM